MKYEFFKFEAFGNRISEVGVGKSLEDFKKFKKEMERKYKQPLHFIIYGYYCNVNHILPGCSLGHAHKKCLGMVPYADILTPSGDVINVAVHHIYEKGQPELANEGGVI